MLTDVEIDDIRQARRPATPAECKWLHENGYIKGTIAYHAGLCRDYDPGRHVVMHHDGTVRPPDIVMRCRKAAGRIEHPDFSNWPRLDLEPGNVRRWEEAVRNRGIVAGDIVRHDPGPMNRDVVWEPQPGPQWDFVSCPATECFYGGARGGGKTDAVLGEWIRHADLYGPDANALVVRRKLVQLRDMTERSKQLYYRIGATYSIQEKVWVFRNGARLTFAHLDNDGDAENYQGHSYTRIYIEELVNFPSKDPIDKLMATLRSGVGVPGCFRATGNPGGPGHLWVKRRYIDPARLGRKLIVDEFTDPFDGKVIHEYRTFIPARVIDNKFLRDTPYVTNLMRIGNEKLRQAWLLGDWDQIAGAFFEEFDERVHVIPASAIRRIMAENPQWMRFMAGDWGSAKPFCFGWYVVVGDATRITRSDGTPGLIPRGALVKFAEDYGAKDHNNVGLKLTVEQVADRLLQCEATHGRAKISNRVLDPACFAEDGGPSIAERFSGKGLHFGRADNARAGRNGSMGGWDALRQRLVGDGQRPMIYFSDVCVDTIRTLPALQHDLDKPEDVDTEGEDHAGDETRYAVMSRPWIRGEPETEGNRPAIVIDLKTGKAEGSLEKLFQETERNERRRLSLVRSRVPRI